MKNSIRTTILVLATMLAAGSVSVRGADLVALSPQTWDRYAPHGKEVDAIHGDFAIANESILAVVAHPKRGRNANMTVRDVGGCLIDLTRRDAQSDQLSAFYPGAQLRELRFAGVDVESPRAYETDDIDSLFVQARQVTLRLVATPREREPDVEVAYTVRDGWNAVRVTTTFTNRRSEPVEVGLVDSIRIDGNSFERSPEGKSGIFWAYDRPFGQAYGVVADDRTILSSTARQSFIRYGDGDSKVTLTLAPGESFRLTRRVIPGRDLFEVMRHARPGSPAADGQACRLDVVDSAGKAVAGADVDLAAGGRVFAKGRTDRNGKVEVYGPKGPITLTISAPGRGKPTVLDLPELPDSRSVQLPEIGAVAAHITDERGGPIPCKVQFVGRDGTATPNFGPTTGEHAVRNVYYSQDGRFRRELGPGSYDVIVSFGPEYDAVFTRIDVTAGKEAKLEAKLVRTVRTDGWISADFHSHSSPSGDNTSSQLGRVLNLLCEHIEFAPCTEHNRLSTYAPHLERLGAERLMATCVGIELTGTPLPLNHQNAFPMVLKPGLQDGGGPTNDLDPATQIERLALWDNRSEKLVQVNHPDIGWMFRDRNGDHEPDAGFSGMFGHIDVIEVHPPHWIFDGPTVAQDGRPENNTIVNWLQLLNQGRKIPGVVNTDAHENFHGSGWLRNYIKSPTDDPARIRTLDVVRASERGNLVMSNGPFLEVALVAKDEPARSAIPGDGIALPAGKGTLRIKVQCPNWFDVDRVQVFLNGHAEETLNFTRASSPHGFSSNVVKFEKEVPLALAADAHVIVAAIGEHSRLGTVMGPEHAPELPVAVSNPIYVDVDGGGFKPDKEPLGKLPVKGGQ